MPKIVYVGPHAEVDTELATRTQRAKRGEPVDVSDDEAKALLDRNRGGGDWQTPKEATHTLKAADDGGKE